MTLRAPTVRETVGGIGALALVLGVLAAFAPGVLPRSLVETTAMLESQVDAWIWVLVLSLVVYLYALYRFWRADEGTVERLVARDADDAAVDVPDLDAATVGFDPERPGRGFDYAMARTVAQLDANPNAWEADRVREDLQTAVVAVRARDGFDERIVREQVADGSWTEDRVAAAFLGGPDAPGVSLWQRAYAWLYPARAFERRVERVVAEIERQAALDDVPAATAHGSADATDVRDADRNSGREPDEHVDGKTDEALEEVAS